MQQMTIHPIMNNLREPRKTLLAQMDCYSDKNLQRHISNFFFIQLEHSLLILIQFASFAVSLLRESAISCHFSSLLAATLAFRPCLLLLKVLWSRAQVQQGVGTSQKCFSCWTLASIFRLQLLASLSVLQSLPSFLLAHAGARRRITSELYLDLDRAKFVRVSFCIPNRRSV